MLVLLEKLGLRTCETRSEKIRGTVACRSEEHTPQLSPSRNAEKARWSAHEGTCVLSEMALLENASPYLVTIPLEEDDPQRQKNSEKSGAACWFPNPSMPPGPALLLFAKEGPSLVHRGDVLRWVLV